MIITNTMNAIFIVPVIVILLSAFPSFAFAQTDNSGSSGSSDNSGSGSTDNSGSSSGSSGSGSTDNRGSSGSTDNSGSGATTTPAPQPSTQTCPDGSVIDASATCPTSTTGNNNPSTVSCNPNDPNPPASCNKPSQPDSSGSCPSDTRTTNNGICCPAGTISKHAYCQTQAEQDKNNAISRQKSCDIIGGAASLATGPVGKAITGASGLIGCK